MTEDKKITEKTQTPVVGTNDQLGDKRIIRRPQRGGSNQRFAGKRKERGQHQEHEFEKRIISIRNM